MKTLYLFLIAALLPLNALAQSSGSFDLNSFGQSYIAAQDNTRVAPMPTPVAVKNPAAVSKPKDDLKPKVKSHLTSYMAYCDAHMDDCNGKDGEIRAFAKTIGNGRCNNRGYNCVRGVLEMCQSLLGQKEITPMYYMACGAMLGKLGERDCAAGRATCGAQLQGALYFGLRASAACYKSYEENPERQTKAKVQLDRFAQVVNKNVKGVYVKKVSQSQSVPHILVWEGVAQVRDAAVMKVLEFAFEKLAWRAAGTVVGVAGTPLLAFSGFMLFHEIAAAEMNKEVCLNWSSYYNGNYANVAGSVQKMSASVK